MTSTANSRLSLRSPKRHKSSHMKYSCCNHVQTTRSIFKAHIKILYLLAIRITCSINTAIHSSTSIINIHIQTDLSLRATRLLNLVVYLNHRWKRGIQFYQFCHLVVLSIFIDSPSITFTIVSRPVKDEVILYFYLLRRWSGWQKRANVNYCNCK